MRVAVVGGGISGLAAAWELRNAAKVTVFEPGRLGGKIRTSEFEGVPVDEGPDAFITRTPAAMQLCAELGLTEDLVAPAAGRTLLWVGDRLRPLPAGLVLGVPGRLGPVVRSGLLSPAGIARAGLDLVLPRTPVGEDIGVGELVAARFGREVATQLVEPLLGSIHAARIDGLSTAATAPLLLTTARRRRSLLLGLQAPPQPDGGSATTPLFLTLPAGLGHLVERLVEELERAGTRFEQAAVGSVAGDGGGVELAGIGRFDRAILAVPAPEAARLLGPATPPGLAGIEQTSVTLVTLSYAATDLDLPPGVNGLLVPPGEGRLMTACSFGSNKWPQWAAPGRVVLRASVGRQGDRRADDLDDNALVATLAAELARALGARGAPGAARVSRWPGAFPFFRVGHLGLVAGIDAELRRRLPAVTLAGASYGGAGVPACIASGRGAAAALLAA